jgi:hypothetical protein
VHLFSIGFPIKSRRRKSGPCSGSQKRVEYSEATLAANRALASTVSKQKPGIPTTMVAEAAVEGPGTGGGSCAYFGWSEGGACSGGRRWAGRRDT